MDTARGIPRLTIVHLSIGERFGSPRPELFLVVGLPDKALFPFGAVQLSSCASLAQLGRWAPLMCPKHSVSNEELRVGRLRCCQRGPEACTQPLHNPSFRRDFPISEVKPTWLLRRPPEPCL